MGIRNTATPSRWRCIICMLSHCAVCELIWRSVLTSRLPSRSSIITAPALIRAPWLARAERMVSLSPLATASLKPKSATSTCTASCSSRAWARTAALVAVCTATYSAAITTSSNNTSTLAILPWKLLRSIASLLECITKGTLRCTSRGNLGGLHGQAKALLTARLAQLQFTSRLAQHVDQLRVPEAYLITPRWQPVELHAALLVADGKPGIIGDIHITQHTVMNIAAQRHHPRGIEQHRLTGRAFVQAQLKTLGRREGIDVMTDIVAIGEAHRNAGAHRQYMGHKLLGPLIHHPWRGRLRAARGALQRQHGVGQGLTRKIDQLCLQAGSP